MQTRRQFQTGAPVLRDNRKRLCYFEISTSKVRGHGHDVLNHRAFYSDVVFPIVTPSVVYGLSVEVMLRLSSKKCAGML